jgi:hypothetical protein
MFSAHPGIEQARSYVSRIRSMPATALAGFIEEATGMLVRGEVDDDFRDWIEVAFERLDELADATVGK